MSVTVAVWPIVESARTWDGTAEQVASSSPRRIYIISHVHGPCGIIRVLMWDQWDYLDFLGVLCVRMAVLKMLEKNEHAFNKNSNLHCQVR